MSVLIIGAVAAGTKAAAKLMREDPSASVTVLTRDETISHAACALPYYVGDVIADPAALTVNTPQRFEALTGAQVHTGMEATALDAGAKMIQARDVKTGQTHLYSYDKLVLAVGARHCSQYPRRWAPRGLYAAHAAGRRSAARVYRPVSGAARAGCRRRFYRP